MTKDILKLTCDFFKYAVKSILAIVAIVGCLIDYFFNPLNYEI